MFVEGEPVRPGLDGVGAIQMSSEGIVKQPSLLEMGFPRGTASFKMDIMWILAGVGIEALALVGALSVAVTGRMRVAFVAGSTSSE